MGEIMNNVSPKLAFILPDSSQYEVLHHLTRQMAVAAEKAGLNAQLIQGVSEYELLLDSPPDLTIGCNGAPVYAPGILLSDLIGRPHLCVLVDLAYRYFYLLESPWIRFACNDRLSCQLLQAKGASAFFWPPATEASLFEPVQSERPHQILFLASWIDSEKREQRWRELFPSWLVKLMQEVIEESLASTLSFIAIFERHFNALLNSQPLLTGEFSLRQVLEEVEMLLRAKSRLQLIQSIRDLPIQLVGDSPGWRHALRKQKNITFHPSVNYAEGLQWMRQSKIVLNCSPHLREGVQERVWNGLIAGSYIYSDESLYLREILGEGKGVSFYTQEHLSKVEENLTQILNDESLRQKEVALGQEYVLKNQTWDQRIKEFEARLS